MTKQRRVFWAHQMRTATKWMAWGMHWFTGKLLVLTAMGLIRSGQAITRAGFWLELELVPISMMIVEVEQPGYKPPTDEQRERLGELYAQLDLYIQQLDAAAAAMNATRSEIEYYKREYGMSDR